MSFSKNRTPIRTSKGDHYGENSDIQLGQRSRNTSEVPRNTGRDIETASLHILLPMAPAATTVGVLEKNNGRLGFTSSTFWVSRLTRTFSAKID